MSTVLPPIFRLEAGFPSSFRGSFTTKYTDTLSSTFDHEESWFEENIFTETISGGPISMLTKLSSVVVLSVSPLFPGQSAKSIAKDRNPPTAISDSCIV